MKEFDLTDAELLKFAGAKERWRKSMVMQGQFGAELADALARTLQANRDTEQAKLEWDKLIERAAKSRGKGIDTFMDIDLNNKKIVFGDRNDSSE